MDGKTSLRIWVRLKLMLRSLRITVYTFSRYKCSCFNINFFWTTPHSQGKDYYEWKNISKPPRIPAGAQVFNALKLSESYLAPRKSASWWRAFLDPWQLPFVWATPSTFSRDPSTGRLKMWKGAWQLLQTRTIPRKEGMSLLTSLAVTRPRRKVRKVLSTWCLFSHH